MAEEAIFHLVTAFASIIKDEFNLLSGVREEINFISREYERMTAFLNVVEANEEQDQELKVRVRHVREASHEIGDVLELITLCLNRHYNGNGIYRILRKCSYVVMTLKVRHQVATEVRRIKMELGDISQAYESERQRIGVIAQGSGSQAVNSGSQYNPQDDALFLDDHKIVGIEGPRTEIIEWLMNEDRKLQVLTVVGMGGLGKTTLVNKVFNHKDTRTMFKTNVWITVSKTYIVKELLKDIIRQLYEGVSEKVLEEEMEPRDDKYLKFMIKDFLKEKCYLVVVDNIWDNQAWESLKTVFPDNDSGSRVLLTTRMEHIASSACNEFHGKVYKLLQLSDEMGWALFCRKAFQGKACPSHLEKISRDIWKKCNGLPIALVAIGGLLSTKDQGNISEWHKVYRTLGTLLERTGKLHSLQQLLLLSYIDLPYQLRVCFLYLSIYPENYLIDHWRLVRLLIAEGFVQPEPEMTLEEVVADYLTELKNRSLILVKKLSVNGTVKTYHIHSMWREIITSKSEELNIVTIGGTQQKEDQPNNVRRLSFHDDFQNWQEIKPFQNKLHSLLVFGSIDEESAIHLLASLRDGGLLKVLDFRGSPLTTLPKKTTKFPYLKYLSFRGTKITDIPKSIGNLQMLETLDLKDTLVTVLPDEINKLKRLRHLLVYRYIQESFYLPFEDQIGFKAVKRLDNFVCIQKLCSIELNQGPSDLVSRKGKNGPGTIIAEIGKLTQLRRINILKVKSEDGGGLCLSLENLTNLRSLFIGATEENEIVNLESLSSAPQFLQTLGIKGRLASLPLWISSLNNLSKLKLRYSKLEGDPLNQLQNLPGLAELLLEHAYEGESLSFESGGFPRLKKLVLDRLSGLTKVEVIQGAMPRLEKFYIFGCDLLNELPSGIESLTCLRDLQLIGLSYSLISSLNRGLPDGDYDRIKHISKVKVRQFTSGPLRKHHL